MDPFNRSVLVAVTASARASLLALLVLFVGLPIPAASGTLLSTAPEKPDPGAVYLFYMHGRGVDDGNRGSAENNQRAVQALSKRDFVVVSEQRRSGVRWKFPDDHEAYARRVVAEVERLLEAGVPAKNILVSGYSRGGMLTLIASALLDRTDLREDRKSVV